MSEFKPGDRVKYTGKYKIFTSELIGKLGEVRYVSNDGVSVRFDGTEFDRFLMAENLEYYTPPEVRAYWVAPSINAQTIAIKNLEREAADREHWVKLLKEVIKLRDEKIAKLESEAKDNDAMIELLKNRIKNVRSRVRAAVRDGEWMDP